MANDLNRCEFIGRIGRDIELKPLKNGENMAAFSIAVNESYLDKNSMKVKKTEWINIVAYRKLAEICSKYLGKGSLVYIAGKLQISKYTGKDGIEKTSAQIVLENMQMLGSKATQYSDPMDVEQENNEEDDFSDIPF